jgi:hypothetical protein
MESHESTIAADKKRHQLRKAARLAWQVIRLHRTEREHLGVDLSVVASADQTGRKSSSNKVIVQAPVVENHRPTFSRLTRRVKR